MAAGRALREHGGVRPLTQSEFAAFQSLILREAGIFLSDVKKALLVGRLSRRLRELGLTSFAAYHRLVQQDDAERVVMLDAVCTNETHFFREPRQFEFLRDRLLPAWRAAAERGVRPRSTRVWSAACSTGEEPTSLAMLLLDQLPGWEIEVLATDLSSRALDRARGGLFSLARAREIPDRYLKRYMLRGVGPREGTMKAVEEVRARIRWQALNLNHDAYAVTGLFDAIFCRNVLIYFRPETKTRVIERLLSLLARGGCLFLGHAESATGLTRRVTSVGPNVYAVAEAGR